MPRFSANGSLLRINYQMDGNTNTQKDRAGLRLMPMSEVAIGEVKVTTSGYAPEFGQTMGLVYNAITPSGTNKLRGDVSYRFRRTPVQRVSVLHHDHAALVGEQARRRGQHGHGLVGRRRSCRTRCTTTRASSGPTAT